MKEIIDKLERWYTGAKKGGEFWDETLDSNGYDTLSLRGLIDELKERVAYLEAQAPKTVRIMYGTDYSIDEDGECYECPRCGGGSIWNVAGDAETHCPDCGSRIVWIKPVEATNGDPAA